MSVAEMEAIRSSMGSTESGKKILYFSDGTLEIDEDEIKEVKVPESASEVNTKEMDWGPWALHTTMRAAGKTLEVCDYLGESLASFFGITTPKYQFEINEYHRMQNEEEEAKKEKDLEMGNWVQNGVCGDTIVISPPSEINNVAKERY